MLAFYCFFYFALLNFLSDSLIWKVRVRVKRWKIMQVLWFFLVKKWLKLSPKHTTIDLEMMWEGGAKDRAAAPRLFSHSQLHLSLDSYVILIVSYMYKRTVVQGSYMYKRTVVQGVPDHCEFRINPMFFCEKLFNVNKKFIVALHYTTCWSFFS